MPEAFSLAQKFQTPRTFNFYKKNDFVYADSDDEFDIEGSFKDKTFCDDKEIVIPMFFDLNSLETN